MESLLRKLAQQDCGAVCGWWVPLAWGQETELISGLGTQPHRTHQFYSQAQHVVPCCTALEGYGSLWQWGTLSTASG